MEIGHTSHEARVLVLMPTVRDAQRTLEILAEAGVQGFACSDLAHLCRELCDGASAVLLTDSALLDDSAGQLAEVLRQQPSWSAVPFVVVARDSIGPHLMRNVSDALTNMIVVERPVRTQTLMSIVLSALRGRRHQYEIRDAILAREQQAEELRRSQQELARQADQLRAADARKDEFLATLAHELRNPLAPIRTGLELLSMSEHPPAADATLAVMRRQLSHMVRLIDDLLDVSRITQSKLALKRARVSLSAVIDAAVEACRPLIDESAQALTVNLPEQDVWLDADATRVAQAVSNLLNNSSKYTARGGKIQLMVRREAERIRIEVRDDGIGIPRERLGEVFTMFSQIDRTVDSAKGGLGIGLALVRRLVEMHGGTVDAFSEGPGKGSTFTVRLPYQAVREEAPAQPVEQAVPADEHKRILVVDDNEDAAELLSEMLDLFGHETRIANDGTSALLAARAAIPEVIILDIGLPDMSGYEVAKKLRQDTSFARTTLVALTGWGSSEDKAKARGAGFDFHLTKPVDVREVQRVLAGVSERFEPHPGAPF